MSAPMLSARFGVLTVVFALAGWLLAPVSRDEPAKAVRLKRDEWVGADTLRRPSLSAAAIEVAGAGMWGAKTAPSNTTESNKPEDKRWRLAGLYGRGAERRALIYFSDPDKSQQYLKVGDLLPSGHKIASIHEREICIQIGKHAYRFPVQPVEQ